MSIPRIPLDDGEPAMLAGDDVPRLIWTGIGTVAAIALFMLLMAVLS